MACPFPNLLPMPGLCRLRLREHVLVALSSCLGRTPHTCKHTLVDARGKRDFPPFTALEIVRFPEDDGYYLLYQTADGTGTDTWHKTLEDAMHQAAFEFNVKESDWTRTDQSSSS
jgi:hypothetical protein